MSLEETIQSANKTGNVIIGYRESKKYIKLNSAKLIVMANNIPEKMRREVEHNAKIAGVKVEVFTGDSKQLGVFCGKPYPIAVLVVK